MMSDDAARLDALERAAVAAAESEVPQLQTLGRRLGDQVAALREGLLLPEGEQDLLPRRSHG